MSKHLLCWNNFKIGKSNEYTCPLKSAAILIHDYPLDVSSHPLPKLLKEALLGNKEYLSEDSSKFYEENLVEKLKEMA